MKKSSILKKSLILCTALPLVFFGENVIAGGETASEKSPWLVRVRFIDVQPQEDSTTNINGHVTGDSSIVPELDISYFWTDNIATELILGTSVHHMGAVNTDLGKLDLGEVNLLPPTLTMQYHFKPDEDVRPYVGAGLSYIFYYDQEVDGSSISHIEYDNGIGYALQAGVDLAIDKNWAMNFDVKKIFHQVDVTINNGAVTADVDLDPWVIGVGMAYRF